MEAAAEPEVQTEKEKQEVESVQPPRVCRQSKVSPSQLMQGAEDLEEGLQSLINRDRLHCSSAGAPSPPPCCLFPACLARSAAFVLPSSAVGIFTITEMTDKCVLKQR